MVGVVGYLRVKNWEEFQHYKDRLPPWIKLHRGLLTDYEFGSLPDESKAHLLLIWLLASQMDGRIPADEKWVAQRIGAAARVNLHLLIQHGWLLPEDGAIEMLAYCKQNARAEKRTRTTEAEKKGAQARVELPEWLSPEAWAEFVTFRKAQKGWTWKAEKLLLSTLGKLKDAGNDPVAVLEQSIANGWKGLFEVRKEGMNGKGKTAGWWESEPATLAKGRELGMSPRPGELMGDFRGRIRERLGA